MIPNRIRDKRSRITSGLIAAAAAAIGIAGAEAEAIPDRHLPTLRELLPLPPADVIEFSACPSDCRPESGAAGKPGETEQSADANERTYDSAIEVLWDGRNGKVTLIWAAPRGPRLILWDGTMDFPEAGGLVVHWVRPESEAGYVPREYRIDPAAGDFSKRLRPRRFRADSSRTQVIDALGEQELDPLGDLPPEAIWAPLAESEFAAIVTRFTRSRTTVMGLTALLVFIMWKLAR